MKALIVYIILVFHLCSCNTTNKIITTSVPTKPVYSFNPRPEKILIVNGYNVSVKKFRDNKEELFIALLDSSLYQIETDIHKKSDFKTAVITEPTNISADSIQLLLAKYGASHLIGITYLDAYFNQTHVDVTKTSTGKERKAFYDIVSSIGYHFYASATDYRDTTVNISNFHSSRSVVSGLLAAGPNIVSNRKQAEEMAAQNVLLYLSTFFPGTAKRSRVIFTTKEFAAVAAAINAGNYDEALKTCLQLSSGADKNITAKAFYNCAVLSELKNNHEDAGKYLKQSLSVSPLWDAKLMLIDYED